MIKKSIDTARPIHELFAARWSGRALDPERPVAREHLVALLEAARWAPSCYGDEPWRFIVCDRWRDEAAWRRAFECLAEGNRGWACHAPLLILVLADSLFVRNGEPNRWGQYDTGAAAVSLCLQAASLGLVAHQMGGFDPARAQREFSFPGRFVPMAMIAVGYPLPEERIPAELRERELAPRTRRPLEESVFESVWGVPVAQR